MRYLLDTNICIYIANQKPIKVLHKFKQMKVGDIGISVITYGELLYGIQKSQCAKQNLKILEALTALITVLPMPTEAGEYYGEIRHKLAKKGTMIGNNDLWIAAHSLAAKLTLVTNNTKEFARVPHLKLANWFNE